MNSQPESIIRIAVILGTSRPNSFTAKAVSLITDELDGRDGIAVDFIDPATLDLPFPGGEDTSGDAAALQEIVTNATGVVFSSPEYHGTYSAMAKLIIENLGFPSVLAGKPIALVGAASGQIGAISAPPGYPNCWIPV